jgi:tRNA threonylcarbamoyladenosine biosynthesis protein TsaB
VPVLAVDTLLALAQSARETRQATGEPPPKLIVALLDARMDEMYLALHANGPEGVSLEPLQPPVLCRPADFQDHLLASLPAGIAPADCLLAGNVFEVYGAWFSELGAPRLPVWPTAAALLQLAPRLLAQGRAVAAAQALPLYVRDKVAQTTAEREALRLEQLVRLALN